VEVTDAEFDEVVTEIAAVARARIENRVDGARRRGLTTTVHLPAD